MSKYLFSDRQLPTHSGTYSRRSRSPKAVAHVLSIAQRETPANCLQVAVVDSQYAMTTSGLLTRLNRGTS